MPDAEIERQLQKAHRENPRLPAPDATLIARVKKTVKENPDALEKLAWADLLLAEGCAKGDTVSLSELEAKVMPKVRQAITKIDASSVFVDEALQAVRERLLAKMNGEEPRIRQYSGEGPLANWARVAGVRVALNVRRAHAKGPEQEPAEDLHDPLPAASPELDFLRAHLAEKFKVALSDALATLSPQDRNLLRMHLIDGLSLERLGTMLNVHKSTLSRRLQKLEGELVAGTREALQRRFGIRSKELASAMKVFSQRVSFSVRTLLGKGEPDATE
jgi:RNA polymerase sigma-70 factor (ECF subfamily)